MHRLSALDNSFLEIETDAIQANIGGVSIFEGPAPTQAALLRLVGSKLDAVPRYRQRVQRLPFRLGMPVWVDDPHFNLGYHLRRTALPAPGGDAELENLVGRVMSQHLDRGKPLWECWVVEGLEGERWALLWKVHHAMVDGVSATDLLGQMLDIAPKPMPSGRLRAWHAKPVNRLQLAAESARGLIAPFDELGDAVAALRAAPREVALRGLATARTVLPIAPSLRGQPHHTSLNGPIGPHRRWSRARVSVEDVKLARRALGGTVNDVVLALVTHGLRDLLESRGETLDERTVRSMVPVSVRTEAEHGTLANRVSAVFAELPVGIDDPVERFNDLHAQMERVKETYGAVAGDTLVGLAGFAPPMLLALGARLALRTPQRMVNTAATNVPGPQVPLYCAGRRMLESWPYVMLAAHVRIVTAIFSYDGGLYFGVTGDFDSAPDIGVVTDGVTRGMTALLEASGATAAAPHRTTSRRRPTSSVAGRRYKRSSSTTRTAASSAGKSSGSNGSARSGSPASPSRSVSPDSGA